MATKAGADKFFLAVAIILIVVGFFIFSSASLGLLARESSNYSSVAFSQTVLGLFLGLLAMMVAMRLDFKIWRSMAFYVLLAAIVLNALLFVPGFGMEHGGAVRWLNLGGFSFQPSEILKFAFVIYFAAWCASVKDKAGTFKKGLLPLLVLLAISGGLLLSQPDTGSFFLIVFAGTAIYVVAGGKWRHIIIIGILGALALGALAMARPYVKQRIMTFVDPRSDALGASYQVRQSLISIGSGQLFGMGFGKGVHKYTHLPEPVGDSIFAVAGQEFGFLGSVVLVCLFAAFATRGLRIASRVPDAFGRLSIVGIVIMITGQAFVNIGAMLGMVPLSGITLPFVSHGGTSLFITLFEVGIILSISKSQKS